MSTQIEALKIEDRTEKGTANARRMRRAGKVPAVVYSHGADARSISVDEHDWTIMSQHDLNLVDLQPAKGKAIKALVKEVQHDYLKNRTLHIDFQEIRMDEVIQTTVSVHAAPGDPVGLSHGGILEQPMHEIEVSCLPGNLPESIEVDITGLEIDQNLLVSDIPAPEGVTFITDAEQVVFHVLHQAALEEEPAEGEAAEGEVAEGEAAEGEAAEEASEE